MSTNECYEMDHLSALESESIHIIREVVAEFKNPVMLYSVGKDSCVMAHLARKAFFPGKLPFALMHIDTGYKFQEMYDFRDQYAKDIGARLIVDSNKQAIKDGAHPSKLGTDKCCGLLKTQALLDGLEKGGYDAAFGGARRDEEKSRAKERIFSFRDDFGQWDPKNQRPELWHLYNGRVNDGESIRVFPLSNWTEVDIWQYIRKERIPVVSMYFAKKRDVVERKGVLIPVDKNTHLEEGEEVREVECRFRSLGCSPCTGAVPSEVRNIDDLIEELQQARNSERENRVIDMGSDSSMEDKKKEGYF
ncbi:MAG: sulfate adenylyltransferase subunit CysD [Planctomycetes bacterium]|nr:sulfate adenylyltransferase subunit CysD [Planctomycetota bacterium]